MTPSEKFTKEWKELGEKWLRGEFVVKELNGFKFNQKQIDFINIKKKEMLISGGFRSGKTVALAAKLWLLCAFFPGNRILLGRKTVSDVISATLPSLFDVFPKGTYTYKVGPGIIEFLNGSQILIYGLDMLASGDDTGKAAQKIKGITLGGAFIDQLEEVEYKMWEQVIARISDKKIPYQPICATTNPANFWAYDYFKIQPQLDEKIAKQRYLSETGMADNSANLPDGYIEQQMTRGKNFVDRFVLGLWTPDSFTEGTVFAEEHIRAMEIVRREPIRTINGIKIFEEPENHIYQIGVDPSLGSSDPGHISVVDTFTGKKVAAFGGYVNTDELVDKTVYLGTLYSQVKMPLVIPERNGVGQSFVDALKRKYDNIYIERRVNTISKKRVTEKLGWHTSYGSKMQLIDNFKELLAKGFPKIYDKETIDEFKVFNYTDQASSKGASAPSGLHDDAVMSTLLAFWGVEAKDEKNNEIKNELEKIRKQFRKNGRVANQAR